jgi:hypothetical protein
MSNDKDNDQAPDVPGGGEEQRSWVTALASDANQVGTTVAGAAVLYGAKQAWDKIRKPPPPPPPSSSDGEA